MGWWWCLYWLCSVHHLMWLWLCIWLSSLSVSPMGLQSVDLLHSFPAVWSGHCFHLWHQWHLSRHRSQSGRHCVSCRWWYHTHDIGFFLGWWLVLPALEVENEAIVTKVTIQLQLYSFKYYMISTLVVRRA